MTLRLSRISPLSIARGPRRASGRDISVIVPTLNEAKNLRPLVEGIAAALAGRSYEVIIVDDNSRDETAMICAELAVRYPLRLVVREAPAGGLSGAVLHGMGIARGEALVVMDADLQHPPERIPDLLRALGSIGADFAVGSRYVEGATTDETWGLFRKINSLLATWLAKPISGNVQDSMAGFFALRRETFESAATLSPLGYKIALELMCKCGVQRAVEVPIHFGTRRAGESKLSFKQQIAYLRHLGRLYGFKFPRTALLGKLIIGGTSGAAGGWMTVPALAGVLGVWSAVTLAYVTRAARESMLPDRRTLLLAERVLKTEEIQRLERAA